MEPAAGVNAASSKSPPSSGTSGSADGVRVRAGGAILVVPVSEVAAVIDCPPVAPVPGAPPWLLGVASRKGRLLPVADLGVASERSAGAASSASARVLLVESGLGPVAFSVEAVESDADFGSEPPAPEIALRTLAERLMRSAFASSRDAGAKTP